jgi:MazG family protein
VPDSLESLVRLVERLRRECPWDREQTFATLETYLLEETYEVLEALDRVQPSRLQEELGDLLFQIFFLARIAAENGWFGIDEVAAGIESKMIARHPHVFGSERAENAASVKANWEKRKREGKAREEAPLSGIPSALPALAAALRMSERAADLGFDWERDADLLAKIEEEIVEAREEARGGTPARTEEEIGDLLFALVNWARRLRIDPERALRGANSKFQRRFTRVAELASKEDRDVAACDAETLDAYWNRVKAEEKALPEEAPKPRQA